LIKQIFAEKTGLIIRENKFCLCPYAKIIEKTIKLEVNNLGQRYASECELSDYLVFMAFVFKMLMTFHRNEQIEAEM
jgi:hypothetical protein